MKKLEELGVSPAPWRTMQLVHLEDDERAGLWVADAVGNDVALDICGCGEGIEGLDANARLIAASPKLYKALRELHYWIGRLFETGNDESDFAMAAAKVFEWRENARAALAEAAGESEVKNGK